MHKNSLSQIEVIAPNLKRRLSGVTATVVRLIPVMTRQIGIATTGPGLPDHLPHLSLWRLPFLPRDRWRVWHARRNTEMLLGLILRNIFRRKLRLMFTSAAQRDHKALTRWLIAQMDRVVATSERAKSYLQVPSTVVMHGVDTEVFYPLHDHAALRVSLGIPDDVVLLGCFGRIRAQKGVDLLIEAACSLLPSRPRVCIVFTGRVTEENRAFHTAQLKRLAAAGISDRVRFLGEIPWIDVVRHYQSLDLFIAPARWEGFGLTPLEAMACGVPVIASRVGAFESIVPPQAGSLVTTGDAMALTTAIAAWIDNPALRISGGAAARTHVLAHFRIEDEAAALIDQYRNLLALR